ncbi:MAG TPA: hypothetical protein VJS38_20520 [Phenylobacterium sp.]|uniref:hypothetical protein n=1 Tax=Phenylobacterium sp. TaxID=1871053 RepID=UPI002B489B81|nr:hypothetical protein [Phenylobacterium sp.]HKR90561.1 hypothetical protein [Phenylobacterium sp.]
MDGRSANAWAAWRWLLIAGFALIAAVNLPGHLPLDSATGLWEGRHHERMSWGPRMYSAILGFFDHLVPGWGLYTVASLMITALAWAALPHIRRRVSWAGPCALAAAFALPQVLILQGVVWRDVLFADLTVAAFAALALASRLWAAPARTFGGSEEPPNVHKSLKSDHSLRRTGVHFGGEWSMRWPLLAAAVAALAVGALVRQNGGVVIVPWALALGWIAGQGRWDRGLGWAAAGLAAPLAFALLLAFLNPIHETPGKPRATGMVLLAHYDVAAAIVEDPKRPLPQLEADRPLSLVVLRRELPGVWSPMRIDTLDWTPSVRRALWRIKGASWEAQWRAMILQDPLGYLRRRLEVFRWVFLTPKLELCGPLQLGVEGLPQVLGDLGLTRGPTIQDAALYAYARPWFATPFYSHLTYALAAAAVAVFLLLRREAGDIAMAALMVAALGFAATFLIASIACDYRYLYALDLAAITGVLYVAVDPSRRASLDD